MSEYWKSTPKYWCKYCKVYVRDTKFEKQQHEATPRHQGNIQRSLRTLHKDHEKEEREKQRAKDEVARLNGVVSGKPTGKGAPSTAAAGGVGKETPRQATLEDRKKQIQQLADMGVVVPEEFRKDMAMAGDWQTVSVTPVVKPGDREVKAEGLAFGVRKRKFTDQEEEAILEEAAAKKQNWGSRLKTFPGAKARGGEDLDALLGGITAKREVKDEEAVKEEQVEDGDVAGDATQDKQVPHIKKEESQEEKLPIEMPVTEPIDVPAEPPNEVKPATEMPGAGVVFKKRRPKVVQKT